VNNEKRMRWAGSVTRMVEKRHTCRILVSKPEGNSYFPELVVDWRIILK
jgi:hypothetical protein